MSREVDVRVRCKRVRRPRTYEPQPVGSTLPEMADMLNKYGRWGHGRHRRFRYVGALDETPDLKPRIAR